MTVEHDNSPIKQVDKSRKVKKSVETARADMPILFDTVAFVSQCSVFHERHNNNFLQSCDIMFLGSVDLSSILHES